MKSGVASHRPGAEKVICFLALAFLPLLLWGANGVCQQAYFQPVPAWSSWPTNNTKSLAMGDIDGDGDLDLVCGNRNFDALYLNDGGVLRNSPDWTPDQEYNTMSVALGDIDGDGDLDLVCGTYDEDRIVLFLNDGGALRTAPAWSSGRIDRTYSVVLGDIDDDGDLDLVCGNFGGSNMLYVNDGGTFEALPAWSSVPANNTWNVTLGDVDGDDDLDLVCANFNQPNTVYVNDGGTFEVSPAWSSTPANRTYSVTLGDIDGDGDLDLICGNNGSNQLYLNDGGTFEISPAWASAPAFITQSVTLGDVDGDGDLDLVCGNSGEPNTMYLNDGDSLRTSPDWSSEPANHTDSAIMGDADGDGDLDLLCGNGGSNTLYRNDGGALGTSPAWAEAPARNTMSLDRGDIDGDGDLDLVCGNSGEPNTMYLNDGDTIRTSPDWSSGPANDTYGVTLGDINGDGDPDLACGNYSQPNTLYLNDGGIFQSSPVWSSEPGYITWDVALGDIDRDGDLDLVCGNSGDPNTMYLNDGGILLTAPAWQSGPSRGTWSVALGDIDGDGDLDLVCGNSSQSNTLYLNDDGILQTDPAWLSDQRYETADVALGDVDGDGDLDLVCSNWGGVNTVYFNDGGIFQTSPGWFSGATNSTWSVSLGDVDGDGDLDLTCGNIGSNTLYLNDGGVLQSSPAWLSGTDDETYSVFLDDIDGDGDLDLACGNYGQGNALYPGKGAPVFTGDLFPPGNHLPNNGSYLRFVGTEKIGQDEYRVSFTAVDVESDPVWLRMEYQHKGDPTWYPAAVDGRPGLAGPFGTSRPGVRDSIDWDTGLLPFSDRNVVLRLRVLEVPEQVSVIQHIAYYLEEVGPIVPNRPEIGSSVNALSFSTVTVGDTVSADVVIGNSGNVALSVTAVELPSAEMRISVQVPFDLVPGGLDTLTVYCEPRTELMAAGDMRILSTDPLQPSLSITVSTDIRALDIGTELLAQAEEIPLGEAVTVIITPAPDVHVESGYLLYRPGGASAFTDSITLVGSKTGFIAVIPGDAVTEAGFDFYIRVENSGVFATDPAGAPASYFLQSVESPGSISLLPQPSEGEHFVEGEEIRVLLSLPLGACFSSGELYYRRGGDHLYQSLGIQPGDPLPFAAIPDSIVGPRGLEYWAEVQTLTRTLTDPPSEPSLFPRTIRVTVENLEEDLTNAANVYRMMSFPLQCEGTITGMITDDIGGYDITRWRMFAFDTDQSGYLEIPNDTIFSFAQGTGYWLITVDSHRLDTAPPVGLSTSTDSVFFISLRPGWNMIGDPFDFAVPWDSCLVDTLGDEDLSMSQAMGFVIEPPVRWDGSAGYFYGAQTLEPFRGYWVRNLDNGEIVLKVPPREVSPGGPEWQAPPVCAGEGAGDWSISITASCKAAVDRDNIAGVGGESISGWDRADRSEPPMAPGRAIALYFPHVSWERRPGRYTIDMRGGCEELAPDRIGIAALLKGPHGMPEGDVLWGYLWNFDLAKSFSDGSDEVTLAFSGLETAPAGAAVYLIDRHLENLVDLRAADGYRFLLGKRGYITRDREARFALLVGSEEYMGGRELPGIPAATMLHQNYPNPFNPSTVIRYEIAEPCGVEIAIYDVRGALVRILYAGRRKPGRYETGWDGRNGGGRDVDAGVYFYRLKTSTGSGYTRKFVLLR